MPDTQIRNASVRYLGAVERIPLERTFEPAAARNLSDFVAAYRLADPGLSAATLPCAGGLAGFTGKDSPLTTVKGAGPQLDHTEIAAALEFFRAREQSEITFELAPWVGGESLARLTRLGFLPSAQEAVVYRELPCTAPEPALSAVETAPEEFSLLMHAAFELCGNPAWTLLSRACSLLPGALNLGIRGTTGEWIACAQLAPAGDVAIFACDGTLPAARGQGAQTALIRHRLRLASAQGFRYAVAEVAPGGASERNYLRCGFRPAYTRTHYRARLAE